MSAKKSARRPGGAPESIPQMVAGAAPPLPRVSALLVDDHREDLMALFELLREQKIKPVIAQRFLLKEARQAQELLGKGGVVGKIVLLPSGEAQTPAV